MRIIHLSDLHIGAADTREALLRLTRVLWQVHDESPASEPPWLLITGDLLDRGGDHETQMAHQWLQELPPLPLLLCPGNHDYGNWLYTSRRHAEQFRKSFARYLLGDGADIQGPLPLVPVFPVTHRVGNWLLIGLDSTAEELRGFDALGAEGHLGTTQLESLQRLIDEPELASLSRLIYLHHHPFASLHYLHRLKDAEAFLDIIRDRVSILLFGHHHGGLDFSTESQKYGIPLALDAGTSTGRGQCKPRLRYRLIDTDALSYRVIFLADS